MNFEEELRIALRREPPPPDFAARTLREAQRRNRWKRTFALPLAAAFAAAALIPAAYQYRQHQRAVEARDQLITALSITRTQVEYTKTRIRNNMRHRQ
jgi:hypothetical protein